METKLNLSVDIMGEAPKGLSQSGWDWWHGQCYGSDSFEIPCHRVEWASQGVGRRPGGRRESSMASPVHSLHFCMKHILRGAVRLGLTACVIAFASAPVGMASTFDLQTATLEDVNKAFDAGALTSEKLVQLYLARIDAYDKKGPNINSVITLNARALDTARALDAERKAKGPRSKLHGVPVVLKDLFDTSDMPTTAGFLPMKNSQPIHDATVVARLREAGAIILAKVNMSDWFGVPKKGDQSTVLGRTSNPYNIDLSPSGSSGGTGASLAACFSSSGLAAKRAPRSGALPRRTVLSDCLRLAG